jgi:hypothetical protein
VGGTYNLKKNRCHHKEINHIAYKELKVYCLELSFCGLSLLRKRGALHNSFQLKRELHHRNWKQSPKRDHQGATIPNMMNGFTLLCASTVNVPLLNR